LRLLIAIPIYNEEKYVIPVIDQIKRFHDDILIIDDGSTDATPQRLAQLAGEAEIRLITHPENRGYGQSLIDAFRFASRNRYDWVITMDCDEQHEPERIPDFIEEIRTDRWDLISGSRYMHEFNDNDLPPTDRRAINHTITSMLNELFELNLTDSFCGFKAHRVSAMERLRLDVPGYAFPMQLWPQVVWANLRLTEIPVRLIYNDPNRHFGGMLDDAECRLKHYLTVLRQEMQKLGQTDQAAVVSRRAALVPCGADE
jgi:glycosyltransferase involved in cell wall biosynthesis